MITHKFTRRQLFDERSRDYPIRGLVGGKQPRSYTWKCYATLNQMSEGACTGYAVTHEAAARPVVVKGVTNELARKVYRRARQLDNWPGEDYEGSSVLAAIKAGEERGWYHQYKWAFSIGDLALAVGYTGPAVLGINWYENMNHPDANGIIVPDGRLLGGHAILCNGYNVKANMFRLHNSWGAGWGINSECFIHYDQLARLLSAGGEACIPIVRRDP